MDDDKKGESSKKLLKFENDHLHGIIINKDEHVMEFIRNVGTEIADNSSEIFTDESHLEKYLTQLKTLLLNEEILSISQLNEDKLMKFFDFLLPDWRFRGEKVLRHELIVKNSALTELTHSNIVHHMIDLLKTKEKSLYHHVAFNILIQFIYEKVELKQTIVEFRLDPDDLKRHLDGIDDEYLQYILLVLTYHSHPDDYQPHTNEKNEWLKLLEYLKRGHFSKFEKLFKKLLYSEKCKYGSYHEVSFKPLARFYYYIAKTRNFTSVVELIFRLFPHVDENSCLVTSFHEQRNLWIIDNEAKYNFQLTNVYKPIIHYRVCRGLLELGLLENFRDGLDIMMEFVKCKNSEIMTMLDKEIKRCPFMKDEIDQITKTFQRGNFDTLSEGFMRSLYHDMQIDSEDENKLANKIMIAMKNLMNLNKQSSLNAIMGRNTERPENLFEILLSIPKITSSIDEKSIIVDIWNKFECFNTPEILNSKNNRGLTHIDYAIESNDPRILLTLIQCSEYYELFNSQCQERLGMNLFEYYIKISITHSSDEEMIPKFYSDVIMSLFEVLDTDKLPIESIFNLVRDKEYCKTLGIVSEVNESVFLEAKFNIDDVLCMMVGYMKSENFLNNQENIQMKEDLKSHHPIFNLIFMILENEEDKFVETFEEIMILTENHILQNYSEQEDTTVFLASFKYIMFISAMINNRKKIIDKIFESENFAAVKIAFPKNIKVYEGSHYAAMKLLETRYGNMIGEDDIPTQWMNPNMFEDFLESRIKKTKDKERIEIDTTFLIHSHTSRYNIKTKEDVDDQLIFWDDTEALEYISRSQWLKVFLTHPAIATYVDLKWFKYKRIFFWNFWLYVLQMLIYSLYVFGEMGAAYESKNSSWCLGCHINESFRIFLTCLVIFTIIYMIIREVFQFYMLNNKELRRYFKTFSNLMEFCLIITISMSVILNLLQENNYSIWLSCANIFLMVLVLTTMFPYSFMFLHMQLFRKVAKTFAKFLFTFITLLFSYVLIFGIVFDLTNTERKNDTTKGFQDNFDNVGRAGLKVILMLSGEYAIEPFDLNVYQMFVFLIFVLVTYILFNLIIGLTIDDVQQLREEAMSIVVKQQIDKIIQTNRIFKSFYTQYESISVNNYKSWKSLFLTRNFRSIKQYIKLIQYGFMKYMATRYCYLHKIDKIFISLKDKHKVTMLIDNKYITPVEFSLWKIDIERFFAKSAYMEEDNFKKILEIFDKRHKSEYENNRSQQKK